MKVFIVDDEIVPATRAIDLFKQEGHEVLWCQDPQKAVEQAREFAPDIIMLDIVMPVIDGFDVLRALANAGIKVPTFMLSTKDQVVDFTWAQRNGAAGYITKPLEPGEVKKLESKYAKG